MSDPQPLFEDLLSELLDGELDDADRALLLELLKQNPALLEDARQHLDLAGRLTDLRSPRGDEAFVQSVSTHLRQVADEDPNAFPQRVTGRIQRSRRRRILVGALTLAACIAATTLPALLRKSTPTRPSAPAVALAITLPDARGSETRLESYPVGQEVHLRSGRMKLEFINGAVVAVESPAHFTIRSAEEIDLHSGNLNAWCPESAHGFRVSTQTAQLKDLGTSFGVSVGPDGTSDFLVLEGEVEVSNQGAQRTLLQGAAVRASSRHELKDADFETSAFTHTWPLASGIVSTRGEVIPAPPNIPEVVAAHEDDSHVIVIPERRNIELPDRIPADIQDPGVYEAETISNPHPLLSSPGTRGRSYLIRYNPVGIVDVGAFKRFEGSVTFDRPVLAIITATSKLDASDSFASAAPLPATAEDITMRGLEGRQPPHPTDGVQLSADRRTVSVIFWAGESVDEIRVITAEN
ncbi:ferric-dicitrate binding protein FerR (iron transport regulator) [Haloferula luteola]|uniref:Ferric-dicitrate binding protein FerR (Iron transport regulator) n=1 Tax=Haloferula luteola TaxID=595692 RepID=A0A840UYX2_9BACT|nr:FecR domain-containing protein [Haloferula luteola]MBB5351327.1 ferric-dicitrate binding protein FerR (iron transport regulator) [Haloferula luteola]